jgi:Fic family protein
MPFLLRNGYAEAADAAIREMGGRFRSENEASSGSGFPKNSVSASCRLITHLQCECGHLGKLRVDLEELKLDGALDPQPRFQVQRSVTTFPVIDRLKATLDQHRPLDPAIVRNLREDLIVRWTYHSNAIEGNTLTLQETKVALEGITIGGKTFREHLEVVNHRNAILLLEELVQTNEPLTEWTIKALHQLILKGIDDDNAGRYRTVNVRISGAERLPPDQVRVPELMENLLTWCQASASSLHPVERAARIHSDFVKIHPFVDGNGRTARLLMNLELIKAGLPPAVLPVDRRLAYYIALDADHVRGEKDGFVEMVARIVKEGFRPYFHALGLPWEAAD